MTDGGGSLTLHVGPAGTYEVWQWHGAWGDSVPADVVQWATDASLWGGGYFLFESRTVREWDHNEAKLPINVLEGFTILCLILEHGEAC